MQAQVFPRKHMYSSVQQACLMGHVWHFVSIHGDLLVQLQSNDLLIR